MTFDELKREVDRQALLILSLQESLGQLLALIDERTPVVGMPPVNQDGYSLGTAFEGKTKDGKRVVVVAGMSGNYLGNDGNSYPSLSAAASAMYGTRRDGNMFWKVMGTNKYAKEVRRNKKKPI